MTICPDLFTQTSGNYTGLFARLFCALLAIIFLFNARDQLRYFLSRPTLIYGPPPRFIGKFSLPAVNRSAFVLLTILFPLCLILVAANIAPRLFLLFALISYFLYFSSISTLSYIKRKTNLIPLVLLILLVAPGIGLPFSSLGPLWPVVLIKICLGQIYLSSGLQKLRKSGWRWADGRSLQSYLASHFLWGDMSWARALASRPGCCAALSVLVLLFEVSFLICLFSPTLAAVYAVAGLLFHAGTVVTMRVNYLKYTGPVYLIFGPDLLESGHRIMLALAAIAG